MSRDFSNDDLTQLIQSGTREACLDTMCELPSATRRKLAKGALRHFKDADEDHFQSVLREKPSKLSGPNDASAQKQIAAVAVFATASLSELKRLGWRIVPREHFLDVMVERLRPDWIDDWAEALLEDTPYSFDTVRGLVEAGLCTKPQSDAYTLGMIAGLGPRRRGFIKDSTMADMLRAQPDYIEHDIWRLFEVEGGGEFSLASTDKFCSAEWTWSTALKTLSDSGDISRERLIDASLDTLARDFAQFRAGWYSRFHESMSPTLDERAARLTAYLELLGSSIPPTVSFAIKALNLLDKAERLPAHLLLEHIAPVLQARAKGTVTAALRLIANAAKREPTLRTLAASVVVDALIHEAADVQTKTLALIEKLGGAEDPSVLEQLQSFAEGIAPSVRPRFEALAGAPATPREEFELPTSASDVVPVHPLSSLDQTVGLLQHVIEGTSNPIEIEQALDGLLRFAADDAQNTESLAAPLAKRAAAIVKRRPPDELQYQMALLVSHWASGSAGFEPRQNGSGAGYDLNIHSEDWRRTRHSFELQFSRRSVWVLDTLRQGHSVPLLCLPTDSRGFVEPATFVARYQQYCEKKIEPGELDLVLALTRLAPEGRASALSIVDGLGGEIMKALRFALGKSETPGKTVWLWVAAAAARVPYTDVPAIAKKTRGQGPDAGTAARYRLSFPKNDHFVLHRVAVEPKLLEPIPDNHLSSLFHAATAAKLGGSVCGDHVNFIRWVATVWPLNLEPLFSQGVALFDDYSKITNTPHVAFLEPMLMAHVEPSDMGTTLLLLSLACQDPAVLSLASEILTAAIAERRLVLERSTHHFGHLLLSGMVPVGRWTKSLGAVASVSSHHRAFIRNLISGALTHDPTQPPRDIGGLIELLYELSLADAQPLKDASALTYLNGVTAGGKLGRFSKKLLAIGGD